MRRIQRALDKEDLVKELTGGETPCFREIWRLLLFAATLGFTMRRREQVTASDSGKAIPDTYFNNSTAWPGFLYLIGLVETDATDVLQSSPEEEDRLITIFEEYANGGLAFMSERLDGKQAAVGTLLDVIVEVINRPDQRGTDLAITI